MTSSSWSPRVRARRAALSVVLCAGLAAALTACGGDPDEGTNGVGKLSAPEIENKARAAADGAGAVRLSGTLVSKGGSYKIDMKLKGSGGTGTVTSQKSTFGLLRVGEDLFLKAGAGFWKRTESGGASTAAGKLDDKYVKVPSRRPRLSSCAGSPRSRPAQGVLGLQGH